MPELSTLLLFAITCLALNASPGPDMLLVATRSAAQGKAAGFATYLGIAAGGYCHAMALALGLSQLFLAVPGAYDFVRLVGAAYLLYLAWQAFTSKESILQAPEENTSRSFRNLFFQGMLTNILNPKIALFFLALFPQFIEPSQGSVVFQILLLATILNTTGLMVKSIVILLASKAGAAITSSKRTAKIAKYFTGLVFTGLAARLAFDTSK
ncbi:MAG: LysE family translocator [Pseudomonadota bacterium]